MSDKAAEPRRLFRQPLFWVALVAAVALAAGYFARPETRVEADARRSYFRETPGGVAGLAQGIERLGRAASPRITPLVEADPVRGTVMLLEPPLPPSPREAGALLQRVRAGGALVYAPFYQSPRVVWRTPLADSLGLRFRYRSETAKALDDRLDEARWSDHPFVAGFPDAHEPRHGLRIVADSAADSARAAPLLVATDGAGREWFAAAEVLLGEGRILVLADAGPLSNDEAADDPVAVLAARAALAWTSPGDTVFFAEYHQGIRGYRTSAQVVRDFFLGNPGGRALLHLVLVCVVVLACAGLRFGSPAPGVAPPDRKRRSPLEHVSALGDLYRKTRADQTAALLLVARLARSAGRAPPRDVAGALALLRQLDSGGGPGAPLGRVRAALRAERPDLAAIAAGIDEHLTRRYDE